MNHVLDLLKSLAQYILDLGEEPMQKRPPQPSQRRPSTTPGDGEIRQMPGDHGHGQRETLENLGSTESVRLKSKLYYYAAQVTDVYDGDTITVNIDLGLGVWSQEQTIRFWKVNTPEVRGAEREEGIKVRDFVRELLLDREILLRTILDKRGQDRTGKFGRLLGEILVEDEQGVIINVNDLLLEQNMGLVVTDDGKTIRPPTPANAPIPGDAQEVSTERAAETMYIICIYCGSKRPLNASATVVEPCPNCLDVAYSLT